ncbi:hypothetical protein ACJX0J_008662 [Zea mays]
MNHRYFLDSTQHGIRKMAVSVGFNILDFSFIIKKYETAIVWDLPLTLGNCIGLWKRICTWNTYLGEAKTQMAKTPHNGKNTLVVYLQLCCISATNHSCLVNQRVKENELA